MPSSSSRFPLIDQLHLGLMLAALALAYVLPFELVLLSYAILGPLHYLTEISWLHERSYFMGQRALALVLVACCLITIFLPWHKSEVMVVTLLFALAFGAACSLVRNPSNRVVVATVGFAIGLIVIALSPVGIAVVFLLPTVVHVSLFTFLFMVSGAIRARSGSQLLLACVYACSIAAILAFPPNGTLHFPAFDAIGPKFFGEIGDAFGIIFGPKVWPFDARLSGFLSFAYTYHYLNWFIKVKVIKWSNVPKRRLAGITALAVGSTGLYFVNYVLGISVLLTLSMLHVMLEFPLNAISIRDLGEKILRRHSLQAQQSAGGA
jgi:hypothetical protein